jgi:hypothetical protein
MYDRPCHRAGAGGGNHAQGFLQIVGRGVGELIQIVICAAKRLVLSLKLRLCALRFVVKARVIQSDGSPSGKLFGGLQIGLGVRAVGLRGDQSDDTERAAVDHHRGDNDGLKAERAKQSKMFRVARRFVNQLVGHFRDEERFADTDSDGGKVVLKRRIPFGELLSKAHLFGVGMGDGDSTDFAVVATRSTVAQSAKIGAARLATLVKVAS